jgi:hypothetical protein
LDKIGVGFGAASRSGLAEMEGLLLTGLADRPLPKLIDDALNATDDDYISARAALSWMQRTVFRPMVGRHFIDSPNWPTLALVTILVLRHLKKTKGGFTATSILSRIPFRVGFERLARDLGSKVSHSDENAHDTAEHSGSSPAEKDLDH